MNRPKFFLPKTNCHNTVKEGTAIRHGLPLAAAVSIALVCGCGSHDVTDENTQSPVGPTAGFESPEESFEAFQKAGVANDFSGAVSCLSPESYDAVAATITFPLTLTAAFDPGKMDEINELLGKYDISMDNDTEEFSINKISDKTTYIADVWEWLVENLDDGTTLSTMTTETLGDIAINGDSAQATVTAESGETDDVDFVRLDGRWFLQMPTEPTITSGSGTVVTNDEFEAQFGGDFHQSFTSDDFFSSKSEPPARTGDGGLRFDGTQVHLATRSLPFGSYSNAWQTDVAK